MGEEQIHRNIFLLTNMILQERIKVLNNYFVIFMRYYLYIQFLFIFPYLYNVYTSF